MAIGQTGAIYKSLNFDGKSSREYGVYITGAAVYNAPERAVEMISIPGRNGAFALDQGRFENITVTYPAGIYADNEADFAEAISDFRNYLCSRSGYCRLTDEYNPDEYRLAIYKSGLEVEPSLLRAGEFNITFECKPQRFLTSGETAVAVSSGDTITNPTLFPARPMIEATGYGKFAINGEELEIISTALGWVQLAANKNKNGGMATDSLTVTIDNTYANVGDELKVGSATMEFSVNLDGGTGYFSGLSETGDISNSYIAGLSAGTSLYNCSFVYGTASTKTGTATFTIITSDYGTKTITETLSLAYDGAITFTLSWVITMPTNINYYWGGAIIDYIRLNSTQSALGQPIYFDLDIGEAYKIKNGSVVSVNNAVTIPAELPSLKPGSNTITFDNTFSKMEIVPKWWKV